MFEPDQEFSCPYCGETNSLSVDPGGGKKQVLITDCEVCCHPIKVTVELDAGGEVTLDVKQEDEQ